MGRPQEVTALILLVCLSPALAADASPLAKTAEELPRFCTSPASYRGGELHPGIWPGSLEKASGSLEGELPQELTHALERDLKWMVGNTEASGVTAAVGIPGQGLWSGSIGLASAKAAEPVTKETPFWWASVGKAFTAVAVLQLVAEEKISLSSPLSIWFPDFPNANSITVEHLLTHTGGVFSFQMDSKLRKKKGYKSPTLLVEVAASHGPDFCPGAAWFYSNTGYVMLGVILERLEGKPFAEIIRRRILEPLGLKKSFALVPGETPKQIARGHFEGKPIKKPGLPSVFSAGNLVGTAADMVRFWSARLNGTLRVPAPEAFESLYPMFDSGTFYGQGVMLYDVPAGNSSIQWLGHSGGAPGYKAIILFDVRRSVYVALAFNGDAPATAAANRLLQTVEAYREATRESSSKAPNRP